jgi:hypothetical protein
VIVIGKMMQFGHERLDVDRGRFLETARGSDVDCAAIQDFLEACQGHNPERNGEGKRMLLRIVSMLTRLARRDHELRGEPARYGVHDHDYDYDYDNDNDNEEEAASNRMHPTSCLGG